MKKRTDHSGAASEVYELVIQTAKAKGLTLKPAAVEALRD